MDQKTINQIEQVINKALLEQEKRLEKKFITKDDLAVALEKNRKEIVDEIVTTQTELIIKLDNNKADKSLVAELGSRVVELEGEIAS